MPVIDFKCKDCENEFFEITNSQDKDKIKCPKCQCKDIKQVFGGTAYLGGKGSCSKSSCSGCGGGC